MALYGVSRFRPTVSCRLSPNALSEGGESPDSLALEGNGYFVGPISFGREVVCSIAASCFPSLVAPRSERGFAAMRSRGI